MANISNNTSNTIVTGTSGNDSIWNYGARVSIESGVGNDTVQNGAFHESISPESVTIRTGEGNDSVYNCGKYSLIDLGDGDDFVDSWASNTTFVNNATIFGGGGNDSLTNVGENSYLDGGTGNDRIANFGSNVIVNGGSGNDTIYNDDYGSSNLTIDGGDGDDYIRNDNNSNVTINGGTGDDYIYNSGSNVLFTYTSGDGNDVIEGFNSTSKLQIGDGTGTYSTTKSGSNIIVTVGDGKITLSGAAKLSAVNIAGSYVYVNPLLITGTEGADTINNTLEGATINALGGNDSISNTGSNVSINAGKGNDFVGNTNDNATLVEINLGAGNDTLWSHSSNSTIYAGDGDDTLHTHTGKNNLIFGEAGNDSIEIIQGSGNITVDGGAGNDLIRNTGKNNLIFGGAGSDSIEIIQDSSSITVDGGAGNDIIDNRNAASQIKINAGAGNDSISNNGSFVTINSGEDDDYILVWDDNVTNVSINGGSGKNYIDNHASNSTILSGAGKDSIYNHGKNVTIEGSAGDDYFYNDGSNVLFQYNSGDGNDYIYGFNTTSTLQIGGGIGTYSTTKSGSNIIVTVDDSRITLVGATTLSAVNIAGKEAEKDSWKLNGTTATYGTSSKTLVTVSGVKSLDGLSLNGTTITLATSSLNQENITVSNGYTLALASGVSVPSTKKAWSLSGTTATYNQTSTAGYTLASDAKSINYTAAANKTLATVSGIKSTNGLSIDGKVITVSKAALGTNKVTVSDGYTLALAKNVTKTSTKKAWSLNKTTASYKQTNAAGYKLSNNVITYTKKAIKTLATVSGVKAINGLSIDGKIITVSKAALGTNKVTVSNGYTLALAKNVTKTSTKKAWSLNKTTASYKQTNAAGYKLSNNVITYTKKATKTLATVTGVKSTNGLSIDGKVITVSKAALGTNKVTVSDGYTLALAKNVTKTSTKKAWSLNKTTASYNQATTAGYKLAGDAKSISYAKKATKTLATVSGVKSTKGFTLSGETIELAMTSLSSKVTVSSDDYGFDFASAYKKATITGSGSDDTITSAGQKIIINGGAGNDSIVNKGKNSTINAGAGNDTVVNSGADVMIRGGKGNDSLIGGKGNDIFVYAQGDGNDVITNYNASDRISIESSAVNVLTNGNNVVFTVGIGKNQGKITLQKAKGKTITYFVGDEEFVYPNDNVKYNAAGTAATLKASYTKKKFEPSDYSNYASTLVTIDTSAVKHTLKITGNDQANKITGTGEDDTIYGDESGDTIFGGVGNDELHGDTGNDSIVGGVGDDSLWGNKGSDTLTGGAGMDIFFYDKGDGNDVITDYSSRLDKVIINSSVMVGNPIANDKSGDVTFAVGNGQITFKNSADKYIELVDTGGNRLMRYNPNY